MPDAPDNKPLVHRRGPDGRMQVGPDWETLTDRQIREAMDDGQFDNLPHQGEPLPPPAPPPPAPPASPSQGPPGPPPASG